MFPNIEGASAILFEASSFLIIEFETEAFAITALNILNSDFAHQDDFLYFRREKLICMELLTGILDLLFDLLTDNYIIENDNYFTKDKSKLLFANIETTAFVFPNQTQKIGAMAFYECKYLTSLDIPNTITSIGSAAVKNCNKLLNVNIPPSVISIGDDAFYNCSSLTSIIIPSSVISIGEYAFYNCSSLISVIIPNSVTSIEIKAFANCSSLTSITIPNSVTSIEINSFANCSNLTIIIIPSSVTSIGGYAFEGCRSLTIYAEADSAPSGWHSDWNRNNRPVLWNHKQEIST